jgi:signal transduction histidine kinase
LGFWRAADKKHTILFDVIAVGVIALLLPHGGEGHRLITVSFCVGYVPLQMISDPENVFGNRFSIVAVLGAFAVYLLFDGSTFEYILAGFMVIYGATLFFASDAFRNVVVDALRNRKIAEAAARELESALVEISAERDAKTRFISTASHDLGQPLQAAKLFSEQIADAPNDAGRRRAQLGLDRAVTSAQQMLSHMLNHMRLEADAVTPYPKSVDVGEVIQRLADQSSTLARQHDIGINAMAAKGKILTDVVLLERAIGNLVHNAIVHSGAKRILIGGRKRANAWHIWVIDNGVGIEPEDAARIFEDYAQGSNSRSPVKGGFGLGLSSVKRLAKLLGGEALLDSRWRKGAAFCIALPIQQQTQS